MNFVLDPCSCESNAKGECFFFRDVVKYLGGINGCSRTRRGFDNGFRDSSFGFLVRVTEIKNTRRDHIEENNRIRDLVRLPKTRMYQDS